MMEPNNVARTALAKVYKAMEKMSRQVPVSHCSDVHLVEFLGCAVVGQEWASDPLSRVAMNELTLRELYRRLELALQIDKE